MAAPKASNDPKTQHHYAAQLALLMALRAAIKALWPSLDLADLKNSQPTYATKVAALVWHYAQANVSISAGYYADARGDSGATSPFTVPHLDPPEMSKIEDSVRGALAPLYQSLTDERPYSDAISSAQDRVAENAEKFVADAGREQILQAVDRDRVCYGFARVARPDACSFCLLLASRGAVYKSRARGGEIDASTVWADAKGTLNRYHANCHCTLQPVFSDHYEAPAHIRAAEALYTQSTADVSGSRQKQAAFRKALYRQRNPKVSVTQSGAEKSAARSGAH